MPARYDVERERKAREEEFIQAGRIGKAQSNYKPN